MSGEEQSGGGMNRYLGRGDPRSSSALMVREHPSAVVWGTIWLPLEHPVPSSVIPALPWHRLLADSRVSQTWTLT